MELEDDDVVSQTITPTHFQDFREIMEKYDELKSTYKNKLKKVTKFEIPTIIGFRAIQISHGAPVFVDVPKHMSNSLDIAEYEFKKGKTPFIVKKRVGENFEYWKLEDLVSPL
jgi:DNA-directed RNA polymerase subunit K/omega